MIAPDPSRRVLILEDLPDVRRWLAGAVAEALGATLIDLAADLRAARHWLNLLEETGPAPLVLVDLGLPDGDGADFISEVLARRADSTIIVATTYDDDAHLLAALAAGAHGYLLKDQDGHRLVDRLRAFAQGEPAMSPPIARRVLEQFRRNARFELASGLAEGVLSARETEVLRLVGRGLTMQEAAGVMGVSRHTVADYVKAIYRKLGINNRAEAALEAARRNLV